MPLSLPWGASYGFFPAMSWEGLYQYLYGRHWAFYGFVTAMGDRMPIFKIEAENGQYIGLFGPLLI